MSKEDAQVRTKQIDAEQIILRRKGFPFQVMLLFIAIANLSSVREILPPFMTHDYLIGVFLLVAGAGFLWIHLKLWKLSKERDEILSRYGIW